MIIEPRDVLLNIMDDTLRLHIVDLKKGALITEDPGATLAVYAPSWFYESMVPLQRAERMKEPLILGMPLYPNTELPSMSTATEEEQVDMRRRFYVQASHIKAAT